MDRLIGHLFYYRTPSTRRGLRGEPYRDSHAVLRTSGATEMRSSYSRSVGILSMSARCRGRWLYSCSQVRRCVPGTFVSARAVLRRNRHSDWGSPMVPQVSGNELSGLRSPASLGNLHGTHSSRIRFTVRSHDQRSSCA